MKGVITMIKQNSIKWIIVILLSTFAILFTIYFLISSGNAAVSDPWDLSNFVTKVSFFDSQGEITNNRSFLLGETICVQIKFEESSNKQLEYCVDGEERYIQYQLPFGVIAEDTTIPIALYREADNKIGQYIIQTINDISYVRVTYDEIDREGNPISDGETYLTKYEDIGIILEFQIHFTENKKNQTIKFGANVIEMIDVTSNNSDNTNGSNISNDADRIHLDTSNWGWDGKVLKTVNDVPIAEFFQGFFETDIVDQLYFNVYKSNDGKTKGEVVAVGLQLNAKGELVLPPNCQSQGWYVIEEMSSEGLQDALNRFKNKQEAEYDYRLADPQLVFYVSNHGIANGIKQDFTEGRYTIEPNQGSSAASRQQVKVTFPCGCSFEGSKPPSIFPDGTRDKGGQNLCTEVFTTTLKQDQSIYFSLCADMGAHFVYGDYLFDFQNHNFTDDEIYFLIASFDYINNQFGENRLDPIAPNTYTSGTTNDYFLPRSTAQILLWNVIFRANKSAGFGDYWIHPSTCKMSDGSNETTWYQILQKNGGTYEKTMEAIHNQGIETSGFTVEGTERYGSGNYTGVYSIGMQNEIIRDLLDHPQYYVDYYHTQVRSPEESYVTGVLYIKGDGSRDAIDQQRQLVVQFGRGVTFNNRLVQEPILLPHQIHLQGKKMVEGYPASPEGFQFRLERVWYMPWENGYQEDKPFAPEVNFEGLKLGSSVVSNTSITVTSDTSGLIDFGIMNFQSWNPSGFDFMITEVGITNDGWEYDTHTYWVHISGADPSDLSYTPQIQGVYRSTGETIEKSGVKNGVVDVNIYNNQPFVFTNTYVPTEAEINIPLSKEIIGDRAQAIEPEEGFEVRVYQVGGIGTYPEKDENEDIIIAPLVASVSIYNGETSLFNIGKSPGTYYYYFQETDGNILGYDYDTSSYWVEVEVTDPGTGRCEASIKEIMKAQNKNPEVYNYDDNRGLLFQNKFTLYSNIFPSVGGIGTHIIYLTAGFVLLIILGIYRTLMYYEHKTKRSDL